MSGGGRVPLLAFEPSAGLVGRPLGVYPSPQPPLQRYPQVLAHHNLQPIHLHRFRSPPHQRAVEAHLAGCAQAGTVFIPVATPGINADGHLLRADSVVSLPLYAVRDDGLPTVAEVARALVARLTSGAAAKEGAQ